MFVLRILTAAVIAITAEEVLNILVFCCFVLLVFFFLFLKNNFILVEWLKTLGMICSGISDFAHAW